MPVKRYQVVLAKYLSVLLFFSIGALCYLAAKGVIDVFRLPIKVYPIDMAGLATAVCGVAFIHGLYLPVFFKLGYVRSRALNSILFFGTIIGLPSLSDFMRENRDNAFIQWLIHFFKGQSDGMILTLILLMVFALSMVSYRLSVKFYQNREF